MRGGILAAGLASALILAGCADAPPSQQQQQGAAADPRQAAKGDRYDRDREICRRAVDENTRTRRNIDDSRREVFQGPADRFGQGALPDTMANYGDSRNADRMIASCMESRGWPQPSRPWWQIGR